MTRYEISADQLGDIARSLNEGATWAWLGRQYGVAPATVKRAYLRKSAEVYPTPAPEPVEVAEADEPVVWACRTFGQLSRDEQRRAARAAGAALSAELTRNAEAISAILDEAETALDAGEAAAAREQSETSCVHPAVACSPALVACPCQCPHCSTWRDDWAEKMSATPAGAVGCDVHGANPCAACAYDRPAEPAAPEIHGAAPRVTVLHNLSRDGFFGLNVVFADGGKRQAVTEDERHALVPVFSYRASVRTAPATEPRSPRTAEAGDDLDLCEDAFRDFNGEAVVHDRLAIGYRARRLRSLSVGDVIVIDDGRTVRAYACASVGWIETALAMLRVVEGAEADAEIRARLQFKPAEALAVTVPLAGAWRDLGRWPAPRRDRRNA